MELAQLPLEFVQASRDDRLALVGRAGHKVGVSQEDQELVRVLNFAWEEAYVTDRPLG